MRLCSSGHALDVGIDYLDIDGHCIPWLDPFKMVSYLADADLLHHLHGGHDLGKFWQKLTRTQPHHPVFEEGGQPATAAHPCNSFLFAWGRGQD